MSRILYLGTKNASSWALRAWLALRETGVEFEERVVDIRKPQRFANLAEIAKFSPPGAVPVLIEDGEVIFDSLAIMEYANDLCQGNLLPKDARRRAHARSLVAWVHSGMSQLCSNISFEDTFMNPDRALTNQEQAEIIRLFSVLEAELLRSGGPFLVGEIGLPDFSFVPVVRRLLWLNPDLGAFPLSASWASKLMNWPSVVQWMQEAERLPPVVSD